MIIPDNDFGFAYQIIRSSKRRSVSMSVRDGKVVVRAARHMALGHITAFVGKHKQWAIDQIARHQQCPSAPTGLAGDVFWVLGNACELQYDDNAVDCMLRDDKLIVGRKLLRKRDEIATKRRLRIWYRKFALEHLIGRTAHYADIMNVVPRSITIRDYKARWGACTHDNAIIYNWRIIMMPQSIIDYLVVHELSHIIQHNHSSAFWAEVQNILPDYKERKYFLRNQSNKFVF